jgi:hypothetical protein
MTDSVKTGARTTKPESLRVNLSPRQGVFPRPALSVPSAPSHIMTLHRTLGNRAVQRLYESGTIQAALKVGQPNDVCEQEADNAKPDEEEQVVQGKRIDQPLVQRQEEVATAAPPGTEPAKLEQERHESLDVVWYIETEPATPIIAPGTMVVFRLRNSLHAGFAWEVERPGLGRRPLFTLREPSGRNLVLYTRTRPQEIRHSPEQPGHYKATFRGRPMRHVGPLESPGALTTTGSEITVSVEFDVSRWLGAEVLEGEGAKRTERADIAQLERPNAAEGEIAAAFQRIAARLGFQALAQNRREAEEQLELYTVGIGGKTSAKAHEELSAIVQLDDALAWKIERLAGEPMEISLKKMFDEGWKVQSINDVRAFRQDREEKIIGMREALVEAFPALAVVRGGELRALYGRGEHLRRMAVEAGLRRVLDDIETTKRNLATGDLDILRVSPIVAAAREKLGIDADPRKKQAIDRLLKEHGAEEFKRGIAVAGATIFLLFIPGIGPYLAAGLGAAWAVRSWMRVGELRAAAGAGVREGIVGRDELAAATFWALMDTLGAGLDFGTAFSTVKKIAPHVPEAIERVAARSGKGMVVTEATGPASRAGAIAERGASVAPEAATKGKALEGVGFPEALPEVPKPARSGEAGLPFEEQMNMWIDEVLAGEQTSGAKPLMEAPAAKPAVSAAEQVKPITYREFMEEIGKVDLSAVKQNKELASRMDALWEGYLKRKGKASRLFQEKDEYVKFRYGLESGQLTPETVRRFFARHKGLAHPASEAGRVAERIWEEVLVTTEKNTQKYTVTFIDPITGNKMTVNVVPDFMPTGTMKGGKFASATKVDEALIIADSKFTWNASKKVVLDDQIRGMLVLAKQNNKPFVFLLKEGGDVAPAVKRFADALGVEWQVTRDISGMIK